VDLNRLLRSAPVKAEFEPTLPQLLAPRIDSLPRIALRVAGALVLLVVAAVVLIALRNRDPVYSHKGLPATFSTSYSRAMTLEPTRPPTLLLLEQRSKSGFLLASFQISTLHLPAYPCKAPPCEISGLLPVIAINFRNRLMASDPTVIPQSEGRTRINFVPGYTFTYQRTINRTTYWGRYVFITPHLTGDRQGLLISMLTDLPPLKAAAKAAAVSPVTPDTVGVVGVLFEPFERLRFG
jgi:hypothetical protein